MKVWDRKGPLDNSKLVNLLEGIKNFYQFM